MSKKSKPWPVVGTIRKNENGSYIVFNDNVTILVDGQEVKMNNSRSAMLQSPVDKLEGLIKRGFIEEKDVEAKRAQAQETNQWLKYEIVVPPPKE